MDRAILNTRMRASLVSHMRYDWAMDTMVVLAYFFRLLDKVDYFMFTYLHEYK